MATELWLCPDCTMWAANNDDSGATALWLERMTPELRSQVGALVVDTDEEAMRAFSTQACDGCGSPLAGYRVRAAQGGERLLMREALS